LLLFDFLGAGLGYLVDHGAGQQLLLSAQAEQESACHGMGKFAAFAWRYPSDGLHFKVVAGLERVALQARLQHFRVVRERGGQPVDLQISEPHG